MNPCYDPIITTAGNSDWCSSMFPVTTVIIWASAGECNPLLSMSQCLGWSMPPATHIAYSEVTSQLKLLQITELRHVNHIPQILFLLDNHELPHNIINVTKNYPLMIDQFEFKEVKWLVLWAIIMFLFSCDHDWSLIQRWKSKMPTVLIDRVGVDDINDQVSHQSWHHLISLITITTWLLLSNTVQ